MFRVLAILLLLSPPSWGAEVIKTKGKQVLMELDKAGQYSSGDSVFAVDASSGKRKAIVLILKVDGTRALGKIQRGQVRKGYAIQPRTPEDNYEERLRPESSMDQKKKLPFSFGILGGYGMDTLNFTPDNKPEVATAGSGFSVSGFGDFQFNDWASGRLLAGYRTFNTAGTATSAVCDNNKSNNCTTQIGFLDIDTWGRFHFLNVAWAGFGFGYKVPLSKQSTALRETTIVATGAILAGGGVDLKIGKITIPIQVDWSSFFGDAKLTTLSLRAGVKFQ